MENSIGEFTTANVVKVASEGGVFCIGGSVVGVPPKKVRKSKKGRFAK